MLCKHKTFVNRLYFTQWKYFDRSDFQIVYEIYRRQNGIELDKTTSYFTSSYDSLKNIVGGKKYNSTWWKYMHVYARDFLVKFTS